MSNAANIDHAANKNRSYRLRPQVGAAVMFTAPTATRCRRNGSDAGRLEIGATYMGVVTSVSNAGFRGIEMSVQLDDGRKVHGISAGARI